MESDKRTVYLDCQNLLAVHEHAARRYKNLNTLVLGNYNENIDQETYHEIFSENNSSTQLVKTLIVMMKDGQGPKIPLSCFTDIEKLIIRVPNKPNHTYTRREIIDFTADFSEWNFMFISSPKPSSDLRTFVFHFEE